MLVENRETNILNNSKSEHKDFQWIDVMKFLMAIFVVAIHTQPLIAYENQYFYRFYDSLLKLAVPFFFMTTGFLLGKKLKTIPNDDCPSVFFHSAKKS